MRNAQLNCKRSHSSLTQMLLLSIKSALVVAFMVYDKKALRISEGKPKSQLKLRIAH